MNNKHIPFKLLSEYYDGVVTQSSRETIMEHLKECPLCEKEYNDLVKMLNMVSSLQEIKIRDEEAFAARTLSRITSESRGRKRNFYFRKVLPTAAAAAVVFVFGVDYFTGGSRTSDPKTAVSVQPGHGNGLITYSSTQDSYREIDSVCDIGKTLSVLRRNRARIFLVTDSYIEGEITVYGYRDITRELRNARYYRTSRMVNASDNNGVVMFNDHFTFFSDFIPPSDPGSHRKVRFRINLQ